MTGQQQNHHCLIRFMGIVWTITHVEHHHGRIAAISLKTRDAVDRRYCTVMDAAHIDWEKYCRAAIDLLHGEDILQ